MSIKFELANSSDDSELRQIMRNTHMQGKISLSFQREPNFFIAEKAGNSESQVLIARNSDSRKILGFGCRSIRKMFVDGKLIDAGYLSGLRGLPEIRSTTALARGYRFLRQLHTDKRVPYYVTTIFDDNAYAKQVLTSKRAGLPIYHHLGSLHTYFLPLYKKLGIQKDDNIIRLSQENSLVASSLECINAHNMRYQFSPAYDQNDLRGKTNLLPDFNLENLYAYKRGFDIVATFGVWDQKSFKQSIVVNYSGAYKILRPLVNQATKFGLSPRLPEIGESLPYLYGSFLCCFPSHINHVESLVDRAMRDWSQKDYAYLLVGVHEQSPFAKILRRESVMKLSSSVYLVYWEEELGTSNIPDPNRVPNLEIATL